MTVVVIRRFAAGRGHPHARRRERAVSARPNSAAEISAALDPPHAPTAVGVSAGESCALSPDAGAGSSAGRGGLVVLLVGGGGGGSVFVGGGGGGAGGGAGAGGSQLSPVPSPSESVWAALGKSGQLSQASP